MTYCSFFEGRHKDEYKLPELGESCLGAGPGLGGLSAAAVVAASTQTLQPLAARPKPPEPPHRGAGHPGSSTAPSAASAAFRQQPPPMKVSKGLPNLSEQDIYSTSGRGPEMKLSLC